MRGKQHTLLFIFIIVALFSVSFTTYSNGRSLQFEMPTFPTLSNLKNDIMNSIKEKSTNLTNNVVADDTSELTLN